MGRSEEEMSSKTEKSSPPTSTNEQGSVHVYPDWAAMQAYYGPRVALAPYFNSTVASGHPPPPYMWGPPQPMMPPYGPPYAAIYAHGGVYAHHAVPIGTQPYGQVVSSPPTGTPLSMDTPAKSPANTDKGLMKKLKGFDGLAMSIGNVDVVKVEDGAEIRPSQSSAETEDSSDGSNGNTEEANQNKRKRSREGTPTDETEDEKTVIRVQPATDKVAGVPVTPPNTAGQLVGTVTALELKNPVVRVKKTSSSVSPPNAVISSESWLQIQSERELKRERRKQSNRDSARRSRLRKQAETEELAKKVEALNAEKSALKSEINQLVENSQKLRQENITLVEKLKNFQSRLEEKSSTTLDTKRNPTDSTENLLSRVNNSGKSSLLDQSRRADAVAAG